MSFLKKLANVILGQDPEIFDDKGRVSHKLPKRKWEDWQNRYIKSQDYNWREHTGSKAGASSSNSQKSSSN